MRFLSFDIESCDGRINTGGMCSFGYCIADENFVITEKDDILINPKPGRFEARVKGKLRYSEEEFRKSPRFPSVYKKIKKLFSDDVCVIGYSILNDVLYLDDACRAYRLPYIDYKFTDVQCIYDIFRDSANSIGLEKAAQDCGIDLLAHRSDEDAKATLLILKHVCEKTGKGFDELIRDYEILQGEASRLEIKKCLTDKLSGEINYNSNTIKKRILKEYTEGFSRERKRSGKEGEFSGKKIYLEEEILTADLDKSLRMIARIYAMGGVKSEKYDSSALYVYPDSQDKYARNNIFHLEKKNKVKCYTLKEFENLLGELPETEADKFALLKEYKKRQNRKKNYAYRPRMPIKYKKSGRNGKNTEKISAAKTDNLQNGKLKR